MPYEIEFAVSVKSQLDALTANQRAAALDAIEKQLVHEPLTETRNRKALRPNPNAPWELRVEQVRVFYDVAIAKPDTETREVAGVVHILAIGTKKGNVLMIGGKKVKL